MPASMICQLKNQKENYKIAVMKKDEENENSKVAEEQVVIPDECGDSMWDTVLEQSPFVQQLKKIADKAKEDNGRNNTVNNQQTS